MSPRPASHGPMASGAPRGSSRMEAIPDGALGLPVWHAAPPVSPLPESRTEAARLHAAARTQAEATIAALDRRMATVANGRVVTFLVAVAVAGATLFHRLPLWGYLPALAAAVAYAALAQWHDQLLRAEARARAEAHYARRGLDRLEGRWHEHPVAESPVGPEHPYALDLDVFGHGSLFQLLDECATALGQERLGAWLSAPAEVSVARERQLQVRELAGRAEFRRDLAIAGRLQRSSRVSPKGFLAWAEAPPALEEIRWGRPLAWAVPLLGVVVAAAAASGRLPGEAPWLYLLIPAAVLALTRSAVATSYGGLEVGQAGAERLASALARMEREPFHSPSLRALASGGQGRASPSLAMRRFARLSGLAEQKKNQLHVVLNLLTLWDLHVFFRLDDWRKAHGRQARGWFDALADVEALCCLGGYLHDRPELAFPTLSDQGPRFVAEQLSHPLLEAPVPNDVALEGPGQLLLVTGSNMSGKSTLLRAIGLNTVLALAGGPISARTLRLSRLFTWTSMRVQDSLEQGVSFFYAEVRRLKQLLDGAAATPGAALVLLDEMLLGTNTRERRLASEEVLRLLVRTGCIGAVTTHDLALAELTRMPQSTLRAVHFQDVLDDGRMRFDYKLREGVVRTTNALRVLALAGIPIRDQAQAEEG
jgi:hypothetical protein